MHPLAFQKLWKKSGGVLPHLNQSSYEALAETINDIHHEDNVHYWGIVGQPLKYRGHKVLHCFNFGNMSINYPWDAHVVNLGRTIPISVKRGGTIRVNERGNALLDLYAKPFLVFGFDSGAAGSELIEPGMMVTDTHEPAQEREYLVALPDGSAAPTADGILFYYMLKRIPFQVEPAEHYVAPGATSGVPAFRMVLQQPMLLQPGWPVLLLEKDRWVWGVVIH